MRARIHTHILRVSTRGRDRGRTKFQDRVREVFNVLVPSATLFNVLALSKGAISG